MLWTAFNNPFNYVLLFLAIVSYLTDDLKAMTVMIVMITLATVLRFWQEFRSLIKAESLRQLVRNKATVLFDRVMRRSKIARPIRSTRTRPKCSSRNWSPATSFNSPPAT